MNTFKITIKFFLCLVILTGVIYPLFITLAAKITMTEKANGSLVTHEGKVIGSSLIAQNFTSDKYFWPRPSANDFDALKSGGSNLGPTSKHLKELVQERLDKMGKETPSDMLFASASGLDPHISKKAAYFQAERIAKARSLSTDKIIELIDNHLNTDRISRLGHQYVNVLILNLALDLQ